MSKRIAKTRLGIFLNAGLVFVAILLCLPFSRSSASVSLPQGKGGEVIAKPTPTPAPKKTPTSNRARPVSGRSNTGVDELAFWETIKNSTDPEDFKAYLEQYPKGKFATLAKNRLKNLENKNGSTDSSSSNPNSATPSTTNPATTNPGPPTSGATIPSTANSAVPPGETKEDAPRHYAKGQEYYKYDFEAAEKEFGIASRLDPRNAEYHFWFGLVLRYECKYVQAEPELKEAVRTPTNPSYYLYLAVVLERNQKHDEAEAALRDAIRPDPKYTSAVVDLARLLAKHGKWHDADKTYREFIQLRPDDGHYFYGYLLADYGRYAEAELEFREAIRAKPNWVNHYALGSFLAVEKKWSEAESELREGLRIYGLTSTYVAIWNELAKLFEDQGKLAEADKIYQEGLRSFPHEIGMRSEYGKWLIRQERWTDSEASYREAIRLSTSPVADYFAGLGDALKGQNRFSEAESEYRKALHLDPRDVRAYRGLSDLLEKLNRSAEIEPAYRAMIKVGCESAPAHVDYADYLARQKRWNEAAAEYKTALELDPKNTEYSEKLKAVAAQKK